MSREQMKARLAEATPGPWEWDHSNPRRVLEGRGGEGVLHCAALLYPEKRNQEFIANAPTDLAKLHAALDAVEALHQQDTYGPAFCICGDRWPCETVNAIRDALEDKADEPE